ncbi:hypothetical protein MTO96_044088, partial [Rhipicephalus appendiculatus]
HLQYPRTKRPTSTGRSDGWSNRSHLRPEDEKTDGNVTKRRLEQSQPSAVPEDEKTDGNVTKRRLEQSQPSTVPEDEKTDVNGTKRRLEQSQPSAVPEDEKTDGNVTKRRLEQSQPSAVPEDVDVPEWTPTWTTGLGCYSCIALLIGLAALADAMISKHYFAGWGWILFDCALFIVPIGAFLYQAYLCLMVIASAMQR